MSLGKKKVVVPYRDSVLTKLLQNALGGNRYVKMLTLYFVKFRQNFYGSRGLNPQR